MIQEEHGIEIERMLHHTLINRLRKVNTALCWLFCILAVEKYLQMFKTQLRKFGLASHTIKKIIYGYTDNTGTKEHNQKLSENRANEIIKMGIGKC